MIRMRPQGGEDSKGQAGSMRGTGSSPNLSTADPVEVRVARRRLGSVGAHGIQAARPVRIADDG